MIRKRTVLVLGAGASHPCTVFRLARGWSTRCAASSPDQTPARLVTRENMIDASEFPHLLVGRLKNNGFATALSIEFAAALRRARPYSIDAFLEMRREFREVGKAAIANALLRAELNSEIAKVKPAVDWYRDPFNRSFSPSRAKITFVLRSATLPLSHSISIAPLSGRYSQA